MHAPDFWQHRNILSTLLLPASLLYSLGSNLRHRFTRPRHVSVPVICIGNLTAGGSGKTPVTAALAQLLSEEGKNPHIISRGYGGSATGPLLVQTEVHSPAEVGDEPLLLARDFPIWVSKDRVAGAKAAIAAGADILLLDDGFQNPGLYKDLSLIVVDATHGFSNGRVLPAGPLREPIKTGLSRADAVVFLKPSAQAEINQEIFASLQDCPLIQAHIEPGPRAGGGTLPDLHHKMVFAFAGIGYPSKFYTTLEQLGVKLVGRRDFPDHHPYSSHDIQQIIQEAQHKGAKLILTTEKDTVKLNGLIPSASPLEIISLPIRAVWDNPGVIKDLLSKATGN
ncbi:tetraacyldisaccharide 4'-kinase [Kiloniella laminariae]|uniref:Tetraacyldisaccharide 4'-kinase n=1 Tax=Kiloniella laminariae TaxID=454162 RepID=A0ABT4LKW5_9PROT|nr:tetraacyldisaccharide 4'-kinase [Kiloniella laminariae]MCZ4281754.1 tetraacyldisaccharide 4'-kinase [Kiloniella laminariae]